MNQDPSADLDLDAEPDGPSKSQRKRDMHALQAIGAELVALGLDRLARVPMSESLRAAIVEYRRLTKHEARRRQLQYIGRLMRNEDPEPIRAALDAFAGASRAETARMHRLERLRERLLVDETVLGEVLQAHPQADVQQLRQLRRNALREQAQGKPPRAYRELFRMLRALEDPSAASADEPDESHE